MVSLGEEDFPEASRDLVLRHAGPEKGRDKRLEADGVAIAGEMKVLEFPTGLDCPRCGKGRVCLVKATVGEILPEAVCQGPGEAVHFGADIPADGRAGLGAKIPDLAEGSERVYTSQRRLDPGS